MAEERKDAEVVAAARASPWAMPAAVGLSVLALSAAGVWIARAPIAENFIARELAARNVQASYRLTAIGLRTQRIEDVVIGDTAHPDLTARWVEIDLSLSGLTPRVANVRAGGVRLRGRWHDGVLSLGQIDNFRSGAAGPTRLPDMGLAVRDARAELDSDFGRVGLALDGQGNLRSGFDGRLRAEMPTLRFTGCAGQGLDARLLLHSVAGGLAISGPVRARSLACPASRLALSGAAIDLTAHLDDLLTLDQAGGVLGVRAVRAADMIVAQARGTVKARRREGHFAGSLGLASGPIAYGGVVAAGSAVIADFRGLAADGSLGPGATLTGTLALTNLAPRGGDLMRGMEGLAQTPLGPVAAQLASAIRRASLDNRAEADLTLNRTGATTSAMLTGLRFRSASGGRMDLLPGSRVALDGPSGRWTATGGVATAGGGLPEMELRIASRRDGGLDGRIALAPYRAPGALFAPGPLQFRLSRGGTLAFDGTVRMDGPLAGSRVEGLRFALTGAAGPDGGLLINPRCQRLDWQRAQFSGLTLDPAGVRLCPQGGAMLRLTGGRASGGVVTDAVALRGRMGSSPFALDAARLSLDAGARTAAVRALAVRMGNPEAPVRFSAATIDGALQLGEPQGHFTGAAARIGPVPLDLTEMSGTWRGTGGALDVDGGIRISDVASDARFNPMAARDVHLRLANGRIVATGRLGHPSRGGAFLAVDLTHDLAKGSGVARFTLRDLVFGPALQPDDLTPSALGVVANVQGRVEGSGAIRWTPDTVTSDGRFSTTDMNLAAAFGPVEGLSTTLTFTDLLALETAPGQVATLRSVNPGIEVRDGRVLYQLLPEKRARVEGGGWPFAGGQLTLLPTTLDFDARGARNLRFRVIGLDAGAFIQQLDLKNISATGTFDGLLPMVFDANGGRIVGGVLVARQPGLPALLVDNVARLNVPCYPDRQSGTLSYVGDVSNAEMGMFGKLAFDALKHLRYRCLTILLDGAIDGEFVTQVAINGVNQGTEEARRSALLRPFLGLPFLFNVKIEAPFRGLLNTYQSFVDPSTLIRNSLGPQYQSVPGAGAGTVAPAPDKGLAVQPGESDKGVTREGE